MNEALSDDSGYRDNIFYQTIGEYYIPIAFAAAAAADSDAKLYYNDYGIEFTGTKLTEALAIVDLIQDAGVQIDGVGLQGHFIVGEVGTTSSLVSVLEQFTAKGVEVAFTELDVRHSSVPADDTAIEQQASDYAAIVSACLQVDSCVGITVWDFDDKYSWVPDTFSGSGEACLYDENLDKKPAWTSVSSVLAAAGTGGVASSAAASTAIAAPTTSGAAAAVGAASVGPSGFVSSVVAASSPSAASPTGFAAATSSAAALPTSAGTCTRGTKTVYVTASL